MTTPAKTQLDEFDQNLIDQIMSLATAPVLRDALTAISPAMRNAVDVYPAAFGILAQNAKVLVGMFTQERERANKAERELIAFRSSAAARQITREAEEEAELIRDARPPLSALASPSTAVIRAENPDEHSAMVAEFDAATRGDYPERCGKCGRELCRVIYDPAVQGRHVECAHCGTVIGGLK